MMRFCSFPKPTAILRHVLRVLIPVSIALTIYLYLYPVFGTCAFPLPPSSSSETRSPFLETAKSHWVPAFLANATATATATATAINSSIEEPPAPALPSKKAPFRLLTLGDPQLEGSTSIPIEYLGVFPHAKSLVRNFKLSRLGIKQALHDAVDILLEDTFNFFESVRKIIDLFGNDFYLAHIYRSVHWWTRPTHVTVLGDLVGSQWLNEAEFTKRANRYWNRVFRGAEKVPNSLQAYPAEEYDLSGYLSRFDNDTTWARRIINVAGNHDIGYAGDITTNLTARFEKAFGKINYELRFELPLPEGFDSKTLYNPDTNTESTRLIPELRLVVLNDMNLDTPALSTQLQDDTYTFINNVINTAAAVEFEGHYTVILTHIPLYKPTGVCVDQPFFEFHSHDGTLKEQNQLSVAASKGFLEGILGMSASSSAPGGGKGRRGIILNGHDHAGCDTYHYVNQTAEGGEVEWQVKRWRQAVREKTVGKEAEGVPGVREITVRSMMGDFGGNAGLLSIWFDEESWQWKADYDTCPLGTQHLWWLVHILDLIAVVGLVVYIACGALKVVGLDVDGLFWGSSKASAKMPAATTQTEKARAQPKSG
ncbi:Putative protein of unknown function [Podospora comata]|uniref:Calcineurin-like phosphoesterase domain-containing protein n=1 Tax=Podospora comata TaxID=48703 RepID=A0ABY6RTE4_PODCO|nr:Putative protein of unknown function [Podospora comata]